MPIDSMSLEITVEVTHAIFHRGYPYPFHYPLNVLVGAARIVRATAPPAWSRQAVPVIKIISAKNTGIALNALLIADWKFMSLLTYCKLLSEKKGLVIKMANLPLKTGHIFFYSKKI
jgi:hypothetical protein